MADLTRMRIEDPVARERVRSITMQIVTYRVAKGEVDPEDEEALRAAVREAAQLALEAYRAAEEFVLG